MLQMLKVAWAWCLRLQDEISTGLDSSTTYLITKCIRNFVHMQDVSAPAPICPGMPSSCSMAAAAGC